MDSGSGYANHDSLIFQRSGEFGPDAFANSSIDILSLLSMAVVGSLLALYFSEPLKTTPPSRNSFLVLVHGVRNVASTDATLTTSGL